MGMPSTETERGDVGACARASDASTPRTDHVMNPYTSKAFVRPIQASSCKRDQLRFMSPLDMRRARYSNESDCEHPHNCTN